MTTAPGSLPPRFRLAPRTTPHLSCTAGPQKAAPSPHRGTVPVCCSNAVRHDPRESACSAPACGLRAPERLTCASVACLAMPSSCSAAEHAPQSGPAEPAQEPCHILSTPPGSRRAAPSRPRCSPGSTKASKCFASTLMRSMAASGAPACVELAATRRPGASCLDTEAMNRKILTFGGVRWGVFVASCKCRQGRRATCVPQSCRRSV